MKLTEKAQILLDNSLIEYENASTERKKELKQHVEQQLVLSEKGENIGFPLDPDFVNAGKAFLNQIT